MNKFSLVKISSYLALLAAGCVGPTIQPTTQAAQVERLQCSGRAIAQSDDLVIQNTTVLEVRPIYGRVHTSSGDFESRVNGATVWVQPPPGVPAEQMARIVQCHSARALLGEIDQAQLATDPFWLPNTWLDIDVKSHAGRFAISVGADNVENGLKVLARANAYADARSSGRSAPALVAAQ